MGRSGLNVRGGKAKKKRWMGPFPVKGGNLGFRPGAFHRRANVRAAFHLEPVLLITASATHNRMLAVFSAMIVHLTLLYSRYSKVELIFDVCPGIYCTTK